MASGPKCTFMTHTRTHTYTHMTAATAIPPTATVQTAHKKKDQNSTNKQNLVCIQVGFHFQCFQIKTVSE